MIPRPSPVNAHIPWMLTPASPVAWPEPRELAGPVLEHHCQVLGISPVAGISAAPDAVGDRAGWPPVPAGSLKSMANRLADETSPYLLQHKDNPVDWYPWGPEALERARARTGRSCSRSATRPATGAT